METELELTFSLQVPRAAWCPGLPGAPPPGISQQARLWGSASEEGPLCLPVLRSEQHRFPLLASCSLAPGVVLLGMGV